MERVFLVRHAETAANILELVQGVFDSELSEKGIRQAKALGEALGKEKIGCVYASDSGRARETMRESLLEGKFKVVYAKELRERNYGVLENKAWHALSEEESKIYKSHDLRPDGGESIGDLSARVIPFFNKMILESHESIMVLTHHNVISAMSCFLMGMPLEKWRAFRTDNCSISEFYYRDGVWRIKRVNDTCHLNGVD
ncbi:MAG: histidine phosphatase family protein [Candidatus Norongarragalinales archaeon]